MPTLLLDAASPQDLLRAAQVLRDGGLVCFPTETVYGLGAHALDADAVRRIYSAKGRPATNPVIVHLADVAEVGPLVAQWPGAAQRLAERFWPGPLSLVAPRSAVVPDVVTAGGSTVCLRVPSHPAALQLLRLARIPVAAPSANRSNRLSPTRAEHVLHDLDGLVDVILDGGPTPGGLESTVVDVCREPFRLLRPGLIAPTAIEEVVGPILRSQESLALGDALPAPGMMLRHYAPRAALEVVEHGLERVRELVARGYRVGWVTWFAAEVPADVVGVQLPGEAARYAAALYAALHELDALGVQNIVVAHPPPGEEWLAIRDRLGRASAGKHA